MIRSAEIAVLEAQADDTMQTDSTATLFSVTPYDIITVRLDRPVENANRDALPHPHSRTLHEVYMTSVDLSLFIEANYPANKSSISRRKPVFGVGANDAPYVTKPTVSGELLCDPAYRAWTGMLKRAYSERYHDKFPTYIGVTVCDEWHSFGAFRAWWLDSYREGWQLDKDLLVYGNREYVPDSCIYVPQWLNSFTADCGAVRGEFPIGVSFCNRTGRYQSQCGNPITGKQRYLGLFNTPEEAHDAWLRYKLELADQLKPEMDAIDQRIYPNVVTVIKSLV